MIQTLKSRLDGHFVACSALATAAAVGGLTQNSDASVVYVSTPVAIPGTFAGVYLNVFTGASGANTTVGWDLNPYNGGNLLYEAAGAGWVVSGTAAVNMSPGTMIDATSTYGNYPNVSTANFTAGVDGIIGFKFAESGNTYYGWARLRKGATNSTAGQITDYAFDNSPNTGILAGAVPAPGSLALLALGAAGLAGRRRK